MIIPGTQALVGYRNGVFQWDGVLTLNGAAIDLTAWSGLIQWRALPGAAGDPYLSLSTLDAPTPNGSSFSFPDPETGAFSVVIGIDDWEGFPVAEAQPGSPTRCVYDVVLTNPDGVADPYIEGPLTLNLGVSR